MSRQVKSFIKRRRNFLSKMQNSPEVEFKRFIFQSLIKYVPEQFVPKMPLEGNVRGTRSSLSDLFGFSRKPGLVKRLQPVAFFIGLLEVVVGLFLLLYVGFYSREYDTMFHTEDSKMMSVASFFGCVALIVTGFILLFALLLDISRSIKFYIFVSVLLCVYMFVLACVKIHYALVVIETDTINILNQVSNNSLFMTKACIIGIATLLGSMLHFLGIVTVFTYYNLKYMQLPS